MESIESVIQRCHARHEQALEQVQTTMLPAGSWVYPYHFCVHYAHEKSELLYEFEQSDISVLPIGRVPFDRAPIDWNRRDSHHDRIQNRQGTLDWQPMRWFSSHGIGVYTGETSGQDGANWHDITFTNQGVLGAPNKVAACLDVLSSAVTTPLVTLTKDGDLRFSCRVPDYLHPNTPEAKAYICKNNAIYVGVKGEMGYSVWDARHEILSGSILQPPLISSDTLFALLNFFKNLLHQPAWSIPTETVSETSFDRQTLINPLKINTAPPSEKTEKLHDIRAGELSPLAIKRKTPVIEKQPDSEQKLFNVAEILQSEARVVGITTGLQKYPDANREIERAFLKQGPILLSLPTVDDCLTADAHYTDAGFKVSTVYPYDFKSDAIADVPYDELLKDPFGRGNLCIIPERYDALEVLDNTPADVLCPKCDVYKACQTQGYHAQFVDIPNSDVIITEFGTKRILASPQYTDDLDRLLGGKPRVCLLSSSQIVSLTSGPYFELERLKYWDTYWKESVLGNFARTMINAIEIKEKNFAEKTAERVRAVVKAFAPMADIISKQMCQVNVAVSKNQCIGMSIRDAVAFGFLDISSVEAIKATHHKPFWDLYVSGFEMLQRFFEHYQYDTDAPMRYLAMNTPDSYVNSRLSFVTPRQIHQDVEKLVILAPHLSEEYLKTLFPNEKVAVYNLPTQETLSGNRVYQLRNAVHSTHSLLNYDSDWDALGLSQSATQYALGVHQEAQRTREKQHLLILPEEEEMETILAETLQLPNVRSVQFYKHKAFIERPNSELLAKQLSDADVIWVFGAPYWPPNLIWTHAKIIFGGSAERIDWNVLINPYRFEDHRFEKLHAQYTKSELLATLSHTGLSEGDKTVILMTALHVPGITDAPETTLFDWEDLEIAGGLDGLAKAIQAREAYEAEAAKIDGTWMPYQMMRVLGISRNEANRILRDEYGHKRVVPVRQEILTLMKQGKTQVKEMLQVLSDRHITTVHGELKKMRNEGIIDRVGWGRYELTDETDKN